MDKQVIRAAVVREAGRPYRIEELTLAPPRDHEVLVRMVATGLCHTDIAMGSTEGLLPKPVILGHEGAGIIERVGSGVTKVVTGDQVVMSFGSCGRCGQCLDAHPAYCDHWIRLNLGCTRADGSISAHCGSEPVHDFFFGQSSFATRAVLHERNIVKVDCVTPLELLGPLGCGIQTGAGAVMNVLDIKAGESFVCIGSGSVGLAAIMAAKIVGAFPIVAIDLNEERLQMALELGATHILNSATCDVVSAVRAVTGNAGARHVLETTGIAALAGQGLDMLARCGGLGIVAIGASSTYSFDARKLMSQGQRIIGIVEGDSVPDSFIPWLIALHERGVFPYDKLVTFYDFDDINQAVSDSQRGKVIKPIIRFPQSA